MSGPHLNIDSLETWLKPLNGCSSGPSTSMAVEPLGQHAGFPINHLAPESFKLGLTERFVECGQPTVAPNKVYLELRFHKL